MMDLHDSLQPMAARVPVEDRLDDIISGRTMIRDGTHSRRPRTLMMAAASLTIAVGAGTLIALRHTDPTRIRSFECRGHRPRLHHRTDNWK